MRRSARELRHPRAARLETFAAQVAENGQVALGQLSRRPWAASAFRPKRQRGGHSKRRTRKRVPLAVLFVDTRRMANSDVLARLWRDAPEAVDEQWVNWWAENGWSPDIAWRAIEG